MNCLRKVIALIGRNGWQTLVLAAGLLFAVGCETTGGGPTSSPTAQVTQGVDTNRLAAFIRVGEQLKIEFLDTNPSQSYEQVVREDGTISLALGQIFDAAGKNETQLQQEIQARYVPKYYQRLTVNIRRENRFYFVDGEVKNPSQRPYTGDITVLKAVASAGGFTVFANKKRIELIRSNGEVLIVNGDKARKNSKLDLPVYPGDKVVVPLSKL
jgi:protein involved in polysaccharide export with SLBB domain